MNNIIHKEIQYFRKTAWLFFVIPFWIFIVAASVYGLYSQFILKIPFGVLHSDAMLLFTTFFSVTVVTLLLIIFLIGRLEVIVTDKGLYYRYVPFFNKFRLIKPIEILHYETRVYKPLREFGGWGIRYSIKQKTNCYNVRGNLGLYIELKNGKRILFGSQEPHKLKFAIDKLTGENKLR